MYKLLITRYKENLFNSSGASEEHKQTDGIPKAISFYILGCSKCVNPSQS
jgi:hypothetical protein